MAEKKNFEEMVKDLGKGMKEKQKYEEAAHAAHPVSDDTLYKETAPSGETKYYYAPDKPLIKKQTKQVIQQAQKEPVTDKLTLTEYDGPKIIATHDVTRKQLKQAAERALFAGTRKRIEVSPQRAYSSGLISEREQKQLIKKDQYIETTPESIRAAKETKETLMKEYPGADVSPGITPEQKYFALEKQKERTVKEVARSPVVRASYVFSPGEWFGTGVLTEAAVSSLTGQDWETKRKHITESYAQELITSKKTPEYAALESATFTGGKAGLMAVGGSVAGGAPVFGRTASVIGTKALEGIYVGSVGYQIGTTIKEPSAEQVARSFVFAAPGAFGVIAKGPKLKYGKELGYKGIYAEWGVGAKAKPLIGIKGRRVKIGTPEINIAEHVTGSYVPKSTLETKIALENIGKYYGTEAVKAKAFVRGSEITSKQKSAYVKAFTERTKTLSPKGVKQVLEFAKKEDALVYGSLTAEAQMPKGKMGRTPGDIDIQLSVDSKLAATKTIELAGKLKKTESFPVRVSKKTPTLIEAKAGGDWHHAVDIHSIESLPKSMMSPGIEGAFGFKYGQRPITINRIKSMRLSEHALRKGASSSQLRKDIIGPEKHRMKDVGDYITSQRVLIESREGGIIGKTFKRRGTKKAKTYLKQFEDVWETKPSKEIKVLLTEKTPKKTSYLNISPMKASPSLSKSLYKSMSMSPSKSISPSRSVSVSPSKSISPSRSVSTPTKGSTALKSISASPTKWVSPSSTYNEKYSTSKRSISASLSRGSSPSLTYQYSKHGVRPKPPTFPTMELTTKKKDKESFMFPKRKYKYTASIGGVLGFVPTTTREPKILTGLGHRPVLIKGRGK